MIQGGERGAWAARTWLWFPTMSRSRWPLAGGVTAVNRGHPPGVRGRTTAPGWSPRRGRRWTASRWQRHVPGRSPGHAGREGPTREGGTCSGPTTSGRGMATMTGGRLRWSTVALGTRAVPTVVVRAGVAHWAVTGSSQPFGWWKTKKDWNLGCETNCLCWTQTNHPRGSWTGSKHPLALTQT